MSEYTRTIQLGDIKITIINIGDIRFDLAKDYHLEEKDWPPGTEATFSQPAIIPIQCVLIQTPQTNLLVDAPAYEIPPESPFAIAGYQPPPGLLTRLPELGVQPDQITHVIITHAHFDHFCGVTEKRGESYQPCFPNARYYLGQADWESDNMKHWMEQPDGLPKHTLVILQQNGLLQFVSGDMNLTPEIQIIAAPGESPGHQIVRVSSGGRTFYVLGDLFHHPLEVEHQEWMSWWADREANRASRQRLVDAALTENALLTAAHIPSLGHLKRAASGVAWEAAES